MTEFSHPIVTIIQARTGSSRLPGKVLLDISGEPMLVRVFERARRAQLVDQTIVATTDQSEDDAIATLCQARGYPCYRGSLYDVLDRFYQAALQFQAANVVRLTADCPLIVPDEIDRVIDRFFTEGVDFAANRLPWGRTVPIGLDTEVCSFSALERAWHEAKLPYEREHVMPYLYDQPGRFKVLLANREPDYGHYRWTVDTPEDLALVRRIYAAFLGRDDFTYQEILDLFARDPSLREINTSVQHKTFTDVDTRSTSA